MSRSDTLLFSTYNLFDAIQHQEAELFKEIDHIDANRLLNTSAEDLCDYLEQKYRLESPRLREDEIAVDHSEIDIDVSRDPNRYIRDRSKPFYIKGTRVQFFIPYEGDQELFKCRPSRFTFNPPRGDVREKLIITFTVIEHDADKIKAEFERNLTQIREYVKWIESDVSPFNASLRDKARQRIEARRHKILKDHEMTASLGFPIKKKADAPKTYTVPTVRRKIVPQIPEASAEPFVPEPALDMEEYENILSIISKMANVFERSPRAFRQMQEEDLRQHFLVQLNAQYEGQATGETFNFEGKTDILIRVEDRNIFIAECKFWRGPKSLKGAIDQLLKYICWRDTKIALLIFNRGKQLSDVLGKIPEVVKTHPNFKRQIPYSSETGFRFILHHRDDVNRELILTVLVFEVPA